MDFVQTWWSSFSRMQQRILIGFMLFVIFTVTILVWRPSFRMGCTILVIGSNPSSSRYMNAEELPVVTETLCDHEVSIFSWFVD